MSITVRPAEPADAMTIFQFICALEEAAFDYIVFERHYMANIRNENYIYLVAVNETNAVIGYISCHGQILLHHCGKVFEIQELFVAGAFRRMGVGQLLMQSLEEELSRQEVSS